MDICTCSPHCYFICKKGQQFDYWKINTVDMKVKLPLHYTLSIFFLETKYFEIFQGSFALPEIFLKPDELLNYEKNSFFSISDYEIFCTTLCYNVSLPIEWLNSKLSQSMHCEWCENPYYYKVLSKYFNALDCLQNLKQTFEWFFKQVAPRLCIQNT